MGGLSIVALLGTSCGSAPEANAPSEAVVDDLHAATGHVEPECYVFGNVDVVIVIEDAGFDPACVVADGDVALEVRNATDEDATFWAVDPPEQSAGARHLRIELAVPAGGAARLDEISSLVATGGYPFFLTERLETHWGRLEVRTDP
jgi:hypothetical protein